MNWMNALRCLATEGENFTRPSPMVMSLMLLMYDLISSSVMIKQLENTFPKISEETRWAGLVPNAAGATISLIPHATMLS